MDKPLGQSIVRGNKVDRDSTRNNDMKQRRTINAAPSVDPGDYVTRAELDALRADLTLEINNLKSYVDLLVTGVNATGTVIDGLFISNFSLQYKDHAGANQTHNVVDGLTYTSHTETFSRGLRKL